MLPTSCGPGPPNPSQLRTAENCSTPYPCDNYSHGGIDDGHQNVDENDKHKRRTENDLKSQKSDDDDNNSMTTRRTATIETFSSLHSSKKRTKFRSALHHSCYENPIWWRIFVFCLFILGFCENGVNADKSKHYYMQSLCKNHFLQQLYRKIDGAVLWSQNERNLDCVITFQTHSILQRFMLRFDMLQLDCNDHLYVYDGAHAVGAVKADLSCRNTKQSVGAIFTRTNFVTLKYVTDAWGTDTNGFKLVITAVKDPKHACKDFRCTLREFCIHPDLICDGVNHCGDGSDETVGHLCQNQDPKTLMGVDITWFILIAVSSLLILCACIVGITICICRRNSGNLNQNTSIQLRQSSAESNGSSKHLHGTLPRDHTTLPTSGNWHHPAGPSGYLRILLKLMMATKVRPIWCLANLGN